MGDGAPYGTRYGQDQTLDDGPTKRQFNGAPNAASVTVDGSCEPMSRSRSYELIDRGSSPSLTGPAGARTSITGMVRSEHWRKVAEMPARDLPQWLERAFEAASHSLRGRGQNLPRSNVPWVGNEQPAAYNAVRRRLRNSDSAGRPKNSE